MIIFITNYELTQSMDSNRIFLKFGINLNNNQDFINKSNYLNNSRVNLNHKQKT